jgi:hypothetical protein
LKQAQDEKIVLEIKPIEGGETIKQDLSKLGPYITSNKRDQCKVAIYYKFTVLVRAAGDQPPNVLNQPPEINLEDVIIVII